MKFIIPFLLFEATQIIQRGTDPYEYKVEDGEWLARKRGSNDWKEISGRDYKPQYQSSIDTLDKENPGLRDKAKTDTKEIKSDTKEVVTPKKETEVSNVASEQSSNLPIIFVAGLDNRSGDLSIEEQTSFLKSSLGNSKVTTFCASKACKKHNDVKEGKAMEYLKSNPNSIVVLFSAGTGYSSQAAKLIKNKNNLYILEPYPEAKDRVQSAVKLGVTTKNVICGWKYNRGMGILSGIGQPTETPKEYGHFPSLKFLSQLLSKK